jgi:MtN3 and saliva related transmembrane protein
LENGTISIIGFIAGTLTTIAFLPQSIKSIKTKETKDLSLLMLIILIIGLVLWIIYGIIKKDLPIIITNVVTIILISIILFIKLKHK